ncbi:MAG: class I SAM-dependent methyltransferase [Candidatus Thermoplasmatota archaeon]|nr:class I SAM-dependent methyltransferase [Candidatus Thermoplasmatota archaeon]
MSNLNLYNIEKDHIRENLNKYTRKAFQLLPECKNLHILDVGCGSGVPTIELAKISDGHIIGIDIDETSLNLLRRKIQETGLNNRVSVIKDSIQAMDFPEESFDIIWAEGSIFVMGFEKSIKKWRRFLKPNGFLVIHDENKDKNIKLGLITKYDYAIIAQFELTANLWWLEYYTPLEQLIQKFRHKYPDESELNNELNNDQIEIDKCKSNSIVFSSFFVIMQKV